VARHRHGGCSSVRSDPEDLIARVLGGVKIVARVDGEPFEIVEGCRLRERVEAAASGQQNSEDVAERGGLAACPSTSVRRLGPMPAMVTMRCATAAEETRNIPAKIRLRTRFSD
jgi:hypothetical protein